MQHQELHTALANIDNPKQILDSVIDKFPLSTPISTKQMMIDANTYANRQMTEEEYYKMKKKYDEKIFLNMFFEGSKSLMELTEKAFDDERYEKEMIKKGLHPLLVNEDEAKYFHSKEFGTHSPVISTHHIRIGTAHGISRTEIGLISDLYKSGYLQEITPEGVIAYALEERGRLIRVDTAKKIAKEINKQRKEQVASLVDGREGEDKMTKKVLEIISQKGMAEQWSFEKVNNYGNQGRRTVKLVEDELGKEIGNMIVRQNSENKEELVANHMEKMCKLMGVAFDDTIAVAWHKIIGRKKKND